MKTTMFLADHWLAAGFSGMLNMMEERSKLGTPYDPKILEMYVESLRRFRVWMVTAPTVKPDADGSRDTIQTDNWLVRGLSGIVKLMEDKTEPYDEETRHKIWVLVQRLHNIFI